MADNKNGQLKKGTRVKVLEEESGRPSVRNEMEGWVSERYVNPVEELVLFEQKGYYHHRILRSLRSNLLITTTNLSTGRSDPMNRKPTFSRREMLKMGMAVGAGLTLKDLPVFAQMSQAGACFP